MKLLLKLLIASIGLLYLLIWLRLMTDPGAMLEQFALVPEGIAGLNSLRANVGVLFCAGTLFCFLSLRANGHWWLLPAAALVVPWVIWKVGYSCWRTGPSEAPLPDQLISATD